CIALDVIAGFPHETPADFEDTYNFLKSLPISYLHVFTYSKRPNTPAATMDEQVSPQEKKWRTSQLIELSNEKKNLFYHQHIGESRKVLIEAESKGNWMFGFTDNYIKIKISYNELKINTIEDVLLEPESFSFS
ncbi:MAG TPA: tRNA (N(6)-L-threonylcarbamoyladenosine(37)-C(2))-methylthiotransferase MtaB, partial [Bacteroidales bacterium]|nr:tRNA (N(6)-L-threonylcarbamoyladenosine(37)-C(2))-methylthiotransferase MtaB [Bacteroidales bacterium]